MTTSNGKRHVILGAGPAGLNAIDTIRILGDNNSSITLICDEPAYSRMVLPYYLGGDIVEKAVFTGDVDYFEKQKVHTIFGKKATSINPKAKAVTLDDGNSVEYDDLLIAVGTSAATPPIPGSDLPGVINMWTLDDAQKYLSMAGPRSEVVIIGAGFIGLIILDGLYKKGAQITFVELEKNILPRMIDARGAELTEQWMKDRGVKVLTGTSASEITEEPIGRKTLRLSDGATLTADVVIMATGIKPNLDLISGSGIEASDAIYVNNRMLTNVPDVYAAGDVAAGPDIVTGGRASQHYIQPTAVDHGRVAGANMAGVPIEYAGSLSMNVLDALGLQVTSFGQWRIENPDNTVVINDKDGIYRKLMWQGDIIVGSVMIGGAEDVSNLNDLGMIKGFIQAKTQLGQWKDYIQENPLDIRRPYIATKTAEKLLKVTLLKKPSAPGGYRYPSLPPDTVRTPWHKILAAEAPELK